VFEKYCASCHSSDGAKATPKKLAHFAMDTYPFGGHHAHTIGFTVREVLGLEGEDPTMPTTAPGSVTGGELDAIVAWSRAFDRAEKAGLHRKQASDDVHRGHVPSAATQ
jgi:mono/diheme cytochrome c family protein